MEKQEYNFTAVQGLSLGNSFGTIKEEDSVTLECTLGIHEGGESGWFEIYDEESGGEDWYAEGGIDFEGTDVVGYDGCFDLPQVIKDKLVELGYSLDEL
jgi:hypothetical protein